MSFVGGVRSISRRCVVTPERAPSCKHQGVGRVGPWLAVTGLRWRLCLRISVRVGCGLSSQGAVSAPAAAGRGLPAAPRRFGGGVGVRRRGRRRGRRRERHPPAPAAPLLLRLCARPPARCDVVHEGAAGARKCCCMVPRRRPQARRAFPGASPGQQWDAPRALQARPLAPHAPEHRRARAPAPCRRRTPPPPPPHTRPVMLADRGARRARAPGSSGSGGGGSVAGAASSGSSAGRPAWRRACHAAQPRARGSPSSGAPERQHASNARSLADAPPAPRAGLEHGGGPRP